MQVNISYMDPMGTQLLNLVDLYGKCPNKATDPTPMVNVSTPTQAFWLFQHSRDPFCPGNSGCFMDQKIMGSILCVFLWVRVRINLFEMPRIGLVDKGMEYPHVQYIFKGSNFQPAILVYGSVRNFCCTVVMLHPQIHWIYLPIASM